MHELRVPHLSQSFPALPIQLQKCVFWSELNSKKNNFGFCFSFFFSFHFLLFCFLCFCFCFCFVLSVFFPSGYVLSVCFLFVCLFVFWERDPRNCFCKCVLHILPSLKKKALHCICLCLLAHMVYHFILVLVFIHSHFQLLKICISQLCKPLKIRSTYNVHWVREKVAAH